METLTRFPVVVIVPVAVVLAIIPVVWWLWAQRRHADSPGVSHEETPPDGSDDQGGFGINR